MLRAIVFGVLAPLVLSACAEREQLILRPDAANIGQIETLLVATNRAARKDGAYDLQRSEDTVFQQVSVSVPPTHQPGRVTTRHRNPDPNRHFVITDIDTLKNEASFQRKLRQELRSFPPAERDVTVFVHGFNNSYSEGLYRHAQMIHDMDARGPQVSFAWPSAARVLGYAHDQDSIIFSRDALQDTLLATQQVAPGRILLVAHSMGAMLAMETIRQIEIERPGWSRKNLSGVVLISPDIDIDVFRSQLKRIPKLPNPFVVFVSQNDIALEISGLINGRAQRLGRQSDLEKLQEFPILVVDITEFADGRGGDHFTVGTSPELMEYLSSPELQNAFGNPDLNIGQLSVSGQLISSTTKRAERAIQWILFPDASQR